MALERRNYKQVVDTTVELAQKVGVVEVVGRIVNNLKASPHISFPSNLLIFRRC